MANLLLNKYQMRTLLDMTELTPAAWSPLASLPDLPRGCAPGEPDFEDLVDKGLVARQGAYAWRPNRMAVAVLTVACTPEELIGVHPNHTRIPGFAIVRRRELVCECTVEGATGDTKLVFPISRNAVILRFIESLTKQDDEPPPTFSVDLDVDESFLFSVAARLEATAIVGVTLDELLTTARADLADPGALAPLAAAGILPTLASTSDLGAVLTRLERAGVLTVTGAHVALSEPARVLTEPARAAFTITHVEVHDGVPRRDGMFVSRHGNRTLLLRTTNDAAPRVVWTEVTRAQLRAMIAAFLLPREELASWVALQEGADRAAAEEVAPPRTVPRAVAPTRVRIPARGLPAFDSPTLDRPPVATLAGGIELTVFERHDDMAHVRADNGWEGWLVAELLEPVAPAPTRVRVPASGLPAFDSPTREHAPIAMLAGGVELVVVAREGTMAHVRADNGWEGWVAFGLLESA